VLEAARVGYWESDMRTGGLRVSGKFKANFGLSPDAPFSVETLQAHVHPDDWNMRIERLRHSIKTGAPLDMEYRVIWPDGSIHWLSVRGAVEHDETGRATRIVGISIDVTNEKHNEQRILEIARENSRLLKSAQDEIVERRRVEKHQDLLLAEINHRVKNTLAIVLSIATQTLRTTETPEAFRASFEARILALAEAHNLLTDGNWEGASLHAIVDRVLGPYRNAGQPRHVIASEHDIRIGPKTSVALVMALNELATNAAKYGALSTGTGSVMIAWSLTQERPPRIHLRWQEVGGAPVKAPLKTGFGTRLIRSLSHDAAAEVMMDFAPDGFICTFDLPLRSGAEA
jgi:PAS domain S-box-containing protein